MWAKRHPQNRQQTTGPSSSGDRREAGITACLGYSADSAAESMMAEDYS